MALDYQALSRMSSSNEFCNSHYLFDVQCDYFSPRRIILCGALKKLSSFYPNQRNQNLWHWVWGFFSFKKKIVLLKIQVYNESSRPLNYLEGPLGSQLVLVTLHNAWQAVLFCAEFFISFCKNCLRSSFGEELIRGVWDSWKCSCMTKM